MKINRRSARSLARDKAASRFESLRIQEESTKLHDMDRISKKQATPDQVQAENGPFTEEQMRTFKIVNMEKSLLRMR
jgi:hypothetical protein